MPYKDPVKAKEYDKQYYIEHKKKIIRRVTKWVSMNKEKRKLNYTRYIRRIKDKVVSHYSPMKRCIKCGFLDIRALSMDHINGKGTQHRKTIKGRNFYVWLLKNGFPKGFQVLCMNCQFIKRHENKEFGGVN